jgi:hypothetical protein
MEGLGLDYTGSLQEPVAVCCEHENEPSGAIKCCEFLDKQAIVISYNMDLRCNNVCILEPVQPHCPRV